MHAVVRSSFGEPLRVVDVPAPIVGPRQVGIRQHASGISAGDWLMARGQPWIMRPVFSWMLRPGPAILGRDVAGVIDQVGAAVAGWSVGDRVIGEVSHAWAERVVATPTALARIPDGVGSLEAAMLPVSGITALQGLRDTGAVRPGERVLIHGASGGVGHLAVQIAKALGAEVTGVCSGAKAGLVLACGADTVIDHQKVDFVSSGAAWDVIFDLVGNVPITACLTSLRPGGRYVSSAGRCGGPILGPLPRIFAVGVRGLRDRRLKVHSASASPADLDLLLAWVADGTLRPHTDTTISLAGVEAGLQRLGAGGVQGRLAIQVVA